MAETARLTLPALEVKHQLPGSEILAWGEQAGGTGANPVVIDCKALHGITTIKGAIAGYNSATAGGVTNTHVTTTHSGSTLNLHRWKPTSSSDTTLVASTTAENFSYIVWGVA